MAQHKLGKITSSTVSKLLTGKGDKLLKGGKTFAKQLARERFGIIDEESSFKGNRATEYGNEHEPVAIDRYEAETFQSVHGRQKLFEDGYLSTSVDGLIQDDGIIEIKCPFATKNHMANLMEDKWINKYEEQVRFQMMLADRDYVKLVSYDPRWASKGMDLHVATLDRDPAWEDFCRDRIRQAEEIISETLQVLEDYEPAF